MRERLDRLMKKLPDGSYECVGYQKQENGKIYHSKLDGVQYDGSSRQASNEFVDIRKGCELADYECEYSGLYIHHDRIDEYTRANLPDGTKVFERDEMEIDKTHVVFDRMVPCVVVWDNGWWELRYDGGVFLGGLADCIGMFDAKLTGISGVTPAREK